MKLALKQRWHIATRTLSQWWNHDPFTQAAAVAYYTIFSFPALVILYFATASIFVEQEALQAQTHNFLAGSVGEDAASQFESIIANTAPQETSTIAFIIGFGTLLFAGLRLFMQFQKALNIIWGEMAAEKQGIHLLVMRRVISFAVMLCVGVMLMLTLFLSTLVGWATMLLDEVLPLYVPLVAEMLTLLLSYLIITLLFAIILKTLPDKPVAWKPAFSGASLATILFLIGENLLSLYFTTAQPASAYGVTGSIILLMLWVSYSCLILLLGAELSHVLSEEGKLKRAI